MLVAEAFVLLALRPDGTPARGQSRQPTVAVGVTGALITELVQEGHLELADGRIHRTGTRPQHPLLAQVLDNLAPHEGKQLKRKLPAVKGAGWKEVVDGLVARGVLGRDKGLLRPTRHRVTDPAGHATLLAEVRSAATGRTAMDARTATLLALAGPCQMLEVVAPERADRAAARRRIDEASQQVPAAAAVRYVVAAMQSVAATGAGAAAPAGRGGRRPGVTEVPVSGACHHRRSPWPAPSPSARQHKARLRQANADVGRLIAHHTGLTHAGVNAELNRGGGLNRISEATVEQLERRLGRAEQWLRQASSRRVSG